MRTLGCGMWSLFLRPGVEPGPPARGTWSLQPWATTEVPPLLACGIGLADPDLVAFLDKSACQGQSQLDPGSWAAGACQVPLRYTERNRGPELVPSL